jgi:hypothetical protein
MDGPAAAPAPTPRDPRWAALDARPPKRSAELEMAVEDEHRRQVRAVGGGSGGGAGRSAGDKKKNTDAPPLQNTTTPLQEAEAAKWRAVRQGADYAGYRAMVAAAHLRPQRGAGGAVLGR